MKVAGRVLPVPNSEPYFVGCLHHRLNLNIEKHQTRAIGPCTGTRLLACETRSNSALDLVEIPAIHVACFSQRGD